MLIRDNKLGDGLAKVLGNSGVALIRGHGFVAVADSTPIVVYRAIYTQLNARVQAEGHEAWHHQIFDARGSGQGSGHRRSHRRAAVGIVESRKSEKLNSMVLVYVAPVRRGGLSG